MAEAKIVLLDMDGVLANLERGFLKEYACLGPHHPSIPLPSRRVFYIEDDYRLRFGDAYGVIANFIINKPGFFRRLPPIDGAKEAVTEMRRCGLEVRICTAPVSGNLACAAEKLEWLEEHFDYELRQRAIVTKDKTLVRGAVLVDDKPDVTGALRPEWEHIVFDAPYNRHVNDKRRMDWTTWREVLLAEIF